MSSRDWVTNDRAWFRDHPGATTRRRPLIDGEFPPEYCVAPHGYRVEVLVEQLVSFSTGEGIRLHWPLLVPVEDAIQ